MCFDRTEDFGKTATGSGLPTSRPSTLNTALGNGESILGDIWDTAKGVFGSVASIQLQKYEYEELKDLRTAEQEAKMLQQQQYAGQNLAGATSSAISSLSNPMAMFGGILILGAGLILATRK